MGFTFVWLIALASSASPDDAPDLQRFEFSQTEMAAPVMLILYSASEADARRAANAAFTRIRDLNAILSDYDPQSELRRLCRDASGEAGIPASSDLWRVLKRADEISRASKGAFDITVGSVVRLWRQARQLHRLPASDRLEKAMALVDYRLVRLDPGHQTVRLLKPGMRIDLGGIAKGYAADEALRVLRDQGIASALVDIGGDIALGSPPPGRPGWRVGVASRGGEQHKARSLSLSRCAVATSGDTEQFVIIDGERYSHIVDPRTGMGINDESCVTVVAPDGMTADALASAASVLGPREGLELIENTPGGAGRIVQGLGGESTVQESTGWRRFLWKDSSSSTKGKIADAAFSGWNGVTSGPAGEDPPETTSPSEKVPDPTVVPTVVWMLEPVPLPESKAAAEAEMKAYTERIPGTKVTFDMVPIPGGKFLLGSPPGEAHRAEHEGPQIEVEVEPFWMGRCEVTWEEYELWGMGLDAALHKETEQELSPWDRLADTITRPTKPYSDMTFGMGKDGYPAICMTHLAAKVYCKWLSAKTGRYYRLPTEAEWEYAARAGTTTAYSFGDDPKDLGDYAWYFDNSDDQYHQVGKKKPNPWGLFDMHGNVAEWVLDQFKPDSYRSFTGKLVRNPLVFPETIYPRVARGGSWYDDADMLRSAARRGSNRDWKMNDPQIPQSIWYHTDAKFVGFRVVRPLRIPAAKEAARYDLDQAQKIDLADYLEYLAGRG